MGANKPTPPDMIRYVQRSGDHGDCVVAAISMATGATYEETLTACTLNAANVLRDGMTTAQILRTIEDLGFTPRHVKIPKAKRAQADFIEMIEDEEMSGILCVQSGHDHHAVYVWLGRVIEPRREKQALWADISSYLESDGWKPTEFITFKEEK